MSVGLSWFEGETAAAIAHVRFRAADPGEIPALQRIERDADAAFAGAGHPELSDGEVIESAAALRIITAGRMVVAVAHEDAHEALVGWAYVGQCGVEPCLGQISVAPSHTRRGIGTALLRHIIAIARQRGERSLVLNTQSDIPWNQPWYEREGFRPLAPAEWTEAMHRTTTLQTAAGLNPTTRVHMRLNLQPTPY